MAYYDAKWGMPPSMAHHDVWGDSAWRPAPARYAPPSQAPHYRWARVPQEFVRPVPMGWASYGPLLRRIARDVGASTLRQAVYEASRAPSHPEALNILVFRFHGYFNWAVAITNIVSTWNAQGIDGWAGMKSLVDYIASMPAPSGGLQGLGTIGQPLGQDPTATVNLQAHIAYVSTRWAQRAANAALVHYGLPASVDVDGTPGTQTIGQLRALMLKWVADQMHTLTLPDTGQTTQNGFLLPARDGADVAMSSDYMAFLEGLPQVADPAPRPTSHPAPCLPGVEEMCAPGAPGCVNGCRTIGRSGESGAGALAVLFGVVIGGYLLTRG